jgi:hypothetical protein
VTVSTKFLPSHIKGFVERVLSDALEEVGIDNEAFLRLIQHERGFREHVRSGLRTYSSRVPNYGLARTMLGENFISPREVMLARNIVYTHKQFSLFDDTAPQPATIEWCRDNGFILIPGPNRPMSLLEIRDLNPEYFSKRFFYERDWLPDVAPFAHDDKVGVGWLAFRKEAIFGSDMKGWEDQLSLVSRGESVPNIAEVAWCIATYKAVRGIRLYPNVFVRTSSIDTRGSRACIGNDSLNNGGSLGVWSWSNAHRSDFVLLTTKRNGR